MAPTSTLAPTQSVRGLSSDNNIAIVLGSLATTLGIVTVGVALWVWKKPRVSSDEESLDISMLSDALSDAHRLITSRYASFDCGSFFRTPTDYVKPF
jgi:hypothetical protein